MLLTVTVSATSVYLLTVPQLSIDSYRPQLPALLHLQLELVDEHVSAGRTTKLIFMQRHKPLSISGALITGAGFLLTCDMGILEFEKVEFCCWLGQKNDTSYDLHNNRKRD